MHPDPFALTPEKIAALPGDGGPEFNRLIFEKSPYLLQHATNPVDWRPWGDEAFRVAAEQERPIFLSIGYATCHWCHVMAHESFEDPRVAGLLNTHFIPVKVDREERPDIDRIYMTVTQGLTGGGGWPMTVVLTPDARPFFAGTYFPRESRAGHIGMLDLLPQIQASWAQQRDKVVESAAEITEWLGKASSASDPGELDASLLPRAFEQLAQRFDTQQGGFGAAPKFPTPHNLSFLLRFWRRSGSEQALQMVETTLQRMRRGGIWDHIGYGFHRYSTDSSWLVPHFEKMLYDQARLTDVYLDAYLATGNRRYAETARETLDYVLRDLTAPEGGFYSAEDADSEGEEGRFYLWTADEVHAVLGKDADLFMGLYGIRTDGNFDEEATGRRSGSNIPHLERPLSAAAAGSDDSIGYIRRVEEMRARLFEVRNQRVHPLLDDKVLTDWNGLAISAMARGGRILGEDRFTTAASKAAGFVLEYLRDSEGRLLKRWRAGEAGLTAHLDDHVFLLTAFLDLYEATWDADWLQQAVRLAETMDPAFWDEEGGGYFFTAQDAEPLLVRSKEVYDGAIPSGNSMAALSLLRLARMTGRSIWEERAVRTMESFGSQIARAPAAFTMMMCALDFLTGETREIVIAGEPGAEDTSSFLEALRTRYLPGVVTLLRPEPEEDPLVSRLAEFTRGQRSLQGRAAAYVCRNQTCDRPVSDPEAMLQRL